MAEACSGCGWGRGVRCSVGVRALPYLCVWSGRGGFCGCPGACCVDVFRVRLGPMAWPVPGMAMGCVVICGCVFLGA